MATVYRADTIGSLLRPPYLKLAREQFEAGQLEPAAYKEIEDRAVDQAIAMQEGVGLDVVTDGELRRHTFIDQLTEQVFGLSPDTGDSGHIPVPFHDEAGQLKSVFTIPLSVTDKLRRRRMMTTEEYAYARARARRPVKVTLPSPLMLFLVWSPQRSRDAYPDPFEMFADGLRLMKEEAEELARMGCRYIQVDAPDFGQLVDPAQRDAWEAAGISVDRVFSEGADMLNELAGVAGVSFGLHLCRGNYDSDWISTGTYEAISKQLFQRATNYDTFLLEYDDDRSGSFSALGDVPDDKTVVLGLVSTKFDRMEPAEQLAARISEAGGFFPLDQLALSTQCGFASAGPGNQISEDAQENKLRLVGEVADRVLGLGRPPGHPDRGRREPMARYVRPDDHATGGQMPIKVPAKCPRNLRPDDHGCGLGGGYCFGGQQPGPGTPQSPQPHRRSADRYPGRHLERRPAGGQEHAGPPRRRGEPERGNPPAGRPGHATRRPR